MNLKRKEMAANNVSNPRQFGLNLTIVESLMRRWSSDVTGKRRYGMHGQQLNFYHTNSRQLKRDAAALQTNFA